MAETKNKSDRGSQARKITSVLNGLKPEEAKAVLARILSAHKELRAEAKRIVTSILQEVSFEDVAAEMEDIARNFPVETAAVAISEWRKRQSSKKPKGRPRRKRVFPKDFVEQFVPEWDGMF